MPAKSTSSAPIIPRPLKLPTHITQLIHGLCDLGLHPMKRDEVVCKFLLSFFFFHCHQLSLVAHHFDTRLRPVLTAAVSTPGGGRRPACQAPLPWHLPGEFTGGPFLPAGIPCRAEWPANSSGRWRAGGEGPGAGGAGGDARTQLRSAVRPNTLTVLMCRMMMMAVVVVVVMMVMVAMMVMMLVDVHLAHIIFHHKKPPMWHFLKQWACAVQGCSRADFAVGAGENRAGQAGLGGCVLPPSRRPRPHICCICISSAAASAAASAASASAAAPAAAPAPATGHRPPATGHPNPKTATGHRLPATLPPFLPVIHPEP